MKNSSRTFSKLCIIFQLLLAIGCSAEEESLSNPLEGPHLYRLGFIVPSQVSDPDPEFAVYVTGEEETSVLPEVSLTFDGQPVALFHAGVAATGSIVATEGADYAGTITIGDRSFEYSVTMVNHVFDGTLEAWVTEPLITWSLSDDNQFQAVEASWQDDTGTGSLYEPLAPDVRSYRFPSHWYETRKLHQFNYRSYEDTLLVYSTTTFNYGASL